MINIEIVAWTQKNVTIHPINDSIQFELAWKNFTWTHNKKHHYVHLQINQCWSRYHQHGYLNINNSDLSSELQKFQSKIQIIIIHHSLHRKTTTKTWNHFNMIWIQIHIKNHHNIIRNQSNHIPLPLPLIFVTCFTPIFLIPKSFIYTNHQFWSWTPCPPLISASPVLQSHHRSEPLQIVIQKVRTTCK